jgi:hypothetical protein
MQPEEVYSFADENGLLIWQDAMFGGSHYPRTPEWLENYAQEIAQQVCMSASGLNLLGTSIALDSTGVLLGMPCFNCFRQLGEYL